MPQVSAYNNIVNPYGAGNVKFDSGPVTAYYLRQENIKRAKDEALDKWYQDLEKNVTPTGMRTIDIPLLIEGKKRAQEFWLQNKRAIKNPDLDGGKSLIEYSKLHNDNLGTVRESQNEYVGGKQLATVLADPNKRSLVNERGFGLIDANASRPIRSEGFISTNDILNDDLFNAKPLTSSELIARKKSYGTFAGDPDKTDVYKGILPTDNTKDIYHVVSKRSKENLKKLGYAAEDDFNNDDHLRATFHKPTVDEYNRIREAGQAVYGEKWEPDSPAKVWAGLNIAENMGESIKEEHRINKQRSDAAAFAKQKQLAAIRKAKTTTEGGNMGNDFESISAPEANGIVVNNGRVTRTANGSNFDGIVYIPLQNIPKTIPSSIVALDKDDELLIEKRNGIEVVPFEVVDGEIVSTKTGKGFNFTKENQQVGQRVIDKSTKAEGVAPFGQGVTPAKVQGQKPPPSKNKWDKYKR